MKKKSFCKCIRLYVFLLCRNPASLLVLRFLTCPGCTGWSILSLWSGKPPCSHVDPDSRGPASVAGRPAAPARDSESSCSAGNGWWWRPRLPLGNHRNNALWAPLSLFRDKVPSTCTGAVTCIIQDLEELMFRESAPVVVIFITGPTAWCFPDWTWWDQQKSMFR